MVFATVSAIPAETQRPDGQIGVFFMPPGNTGLLEETEEAFFGAIHPTTLAPSFEEKLHEDFFVTERHVDTGTVWGSGAEISGATPPEVMNPNGF